jgi:hypothetical protein
VEPVDLGSVQAEESNITSLEAMFNFLPALRSGLCNTLPVPSVVDSRCFGNANPAPRSAREEPFATRTSLERGRALGRDRQVLVKDQHPDGEKYQLVRRSRRTGVLK